MKNIFKNFVTKAKNTLSVIKNKFFPQNSHMHGLLVGVKGDLATNTIGAIIIAVVMIGILVLAIDTFFPTFFSDMFNSMKDKLNANW